MRVEVREFHNTDIADMTAMIEKDISCLPECTQDWIEAEVNNLPFDNYIKKAVRGCLLRTSLIATEKTGWTGRRKNKQILILND